MGFVSWVTKSGIKLAAVVVAVKVSIDQKVWTLEPAEGEAVYQTFTKDVLNGAVVYKEKLPSCEEVKSDMGSKWNKNINCAFGYLNQAPELLKEKTVSFYKSALETKS
ncbi:unnamed protein product [Bursaphelenchus xylophilus]|uniref:MICOS complex subunit MIC13 n=1 Tax=Bursaphelenchus xylophilus TaxID=6326 RepID=A0A1I7SDP5_BURXY|nr:unnamed protein product [Bursaphelenchus xylophilus]CAG9084467.1 unnamed protein product [Bursaphelenchus xylophilus]